MPIRTEEFAWLWQGIVKKKFTLNEIPYLDPIHLHRGGHTHAILLLHGFSSSPAVFRNLLGALQHYDGVVAPTLPGHGLSYDAFSKVKAKDWLACAKEEYQQLSRQYKHVDVLGLSLGGVLACALAQQFKLHHLYLLAPALDLPFPLNLGPRLPKLLRALGMRTFRSKGGNIQQARYHELTYRRLPLSAITETLKFIQTFDFHPPACPTDVFLGRHDAAINNHKVAKRFRTSSHTKIHWLKNSAHILPLDADLQVIGNLIQAHQIHTTA